MPLRSGQWHSTTLSLALVTLHSSNVSITTCVVSPSRAPRTTTAIVALASFSTPSTLSITGQSLALTAVNSPHDTRGHTTLPSNSLTSSSSSASAGHSSHRYATRILRVPPSHTMA